MLHFPLCWFLAVSSFGSGSSSSSPTQPLPGPAAPQQTIITPGKPRTQVPIQPPVSREHLEQRIQEREFDSTTHGPFYIYPGVVNAKEGKWVGYDYLYNLDANIPVEVTIVKPTDATIPTSEEAIRQKIIEEFYKANIDTNPQFSGGRPPKAIFNMMILIYPLNDGFIALCDGRLLETVELSRVTPSAAEGTFQAVTWEHKNLIVAPADNFIPLLTQTIEGITRTFIERFKFFEQYLKRREGGIAS